MSHNQSHICLCLHRIRSLRQDYPLTIGDNRQRSGEEFVDDVISLANGIYKLGIRSGDVVAIAALNSDFYMEWLLAISYIGGIVAPLNYRWSFDEAKFSLEIVNPLMLVVDESCSSWALTLQNDNCISSLKLYAFIGYSSSRTHGKSQNFLTLNTIRTPMAVGAMPGLMWAPNGIAIICFTSGTTGRPKGVAISHTALTVQSLAKIAIVGYNENDVYLHTAPLCHIGGISSCIAVLMVAGCHVFMPKFDAKSSFITINEHQVTSLITVPAMLSDLVSYARCSKNSNGGKTVNKILNGGGSLSSELINLAALTFPQSKIISAYGMTESCSSLTFMTLHDPFHQNSTKSHSSNIINENENENAAVLVGKPAPHIELRVSGDSDNLGSPLVGSILTRGSHVMIGYYSTKNDFLFDSIENGWLDTGDVGRIDGKGNLWLVGRKKDRIKSGGENIYPEEVETVLSQHPGVLKAVVVGIPDSRLGEMVVACIIIRDKCKWSDINSSNATGLNDLSTEILQKYCRQQKLSRYKIPKIFIPWKKPLPLTTTGKLKREDLKKEVMFSMKFSNL